MAHGDPTFETYAQEMLQLQQVGPTTFRSAHLRDNSMGVIFGGQFLAQSLLAASRTAPAWAANSCSSYFLRSGRLDVPIDYEVETVRNGRNFANRRVVARQNGKALFDMLCSFHQAQRGPSHQQELPTALPQPDDVPDIKDYLLSNSDRLSTDEVASYFLPMPVEFRPVDPNRMFHLDSVPEPRRDLWMRFPTAGRVGESDRHQAIIAYLSDFWIGPVANALHSPAYPRRAPVVTISHSIAFHKRARADEWILYRMESPWAGQGIGFTRGSLFDRSGRLIASTSQEVAMGS